LYKHHSAPVSLACYVVYSAVLHLQVQGMLLLYMHILCSVIIVVLKSCDCAIFCRPLSVNNLKYFVGSVYWIMNWWKSSMSQNQYCCVNLRDPVMIYVLAMWKRQLCVHRTKYHITGLMHQHMLLFIHNQMKVYCCLILFCNSLYT
jgi:hypothetical protein